MIVEIKALSELTAKNEKQVISYMRATQKEVGLLLNFGEAHLGKMRFIMTPNDSQIKTYE